ncbi:hypothetical protein [Verrucomicrobium spinosum]|uniref:hypothetical protein n=1 Tax=Verrucomicrobium spinosum TaxID=2736 RepID=UPI0009462B57|nr:hypothetical protein [Verrucomicrobium spinosum]
MDPSCVWGPGLQWNDESADGERTCRTTFFHDVTLQDRRLAAVVRLCQEMPGQELFAYEDKDGAVVDMGAQEVNDYLRKITGGEYTAKDFRTWAGTVLAAIASGK